MYLMKSLKLKLTTRIVSTHVQKQNICDQIRIKRRKEEDRPMITINGSVPLQCLFLDVEKFI